MSGSVATARQTERWIRAEAEFNERLRGEGARLAPGASYINARRSVAIICARGHRVSPRPSNVKSGVGLCRVCAGKDSFAAEASFIRRVTELGGQVVDGAKYTNNHSLVAVTCAGGHACLVRPVSLNRGRGLCRICARQDPETARVAFLSRVYKAGARLAPGASYINSATRVEVICANNHVCRVLPNSLARGQGLCRVCAGRDPLEPERLFRKALSEAGSRTVRGEDYVNTKTKVRCLCKQGHVGLVSPKDVLRGGGVCGQCRAGFDRVYLLVHQEAQAIKVGVASDGRRVRTHLRRGYEVVGEWVGLGHDQALECERETIKYWRNQGWGPENGAPRDGRSETTGIKRLEATRKRIEKHLLFSLKNGQ